MYSELSSTTNISRRSGSTKKKRSNIMKRKKRYIREHYGLCSSIGGAISHIGGAIGKGFESVGRGISSGLRGISRGIGSALKGIGRGISSVVSGIGRGVSSVISGVGKGLSFVGKSIGKGLSWIAKSIGKGLASVGKWIGNKIWSVITTISKGVWKVFKWLGKATRKLLMKVWKFFKRIWKFVKSIIYRALKKLWWVLARIRKFIKWILSKLVILVLVTLLGPVGQMIVRNVFLNGSLDKSWLMYLGFPPFSLFAAFYFVSGAVKKGTGPKAMDIHGIIYSLLSGVIPWLVSWIVSERSILFAFLYPLALYCWYIFMFYKRDKKRCGGKQGFKLAKLLRSSNDMMIVSALIMPIITMVITQYKNYITVRAEELGLFKFHLLFNVIYGVSGYLIANMRNNTKSINNYCKPYPMSKAVDYTKATYMVVAWFNMVEVILTNKYA
jgi:hypothetical protein